MMLGARVGAWSANGAPLPYDAEVEWIKPVIGVYIETGLKLMTDSFKFEAVVAREVINAQPERTLVSNWNSSYVNFFLGGSQGAGCANAFAGINGGHLAALGIDEVNKFYTVSTGCDSNGIFGLSGLRFTSVDDNVITRSISGNWATNTNTLRLFARYDLVTYCVDVRVGGVKIFIDSILPTIDLIPVRFTNERGESEGAMYDKVSGKLFRNAGTGSFIIGPDK